MYAERVTCFFLFFLFFFLDVKRCIVQPSGLRAAENKLPHQSISPLLVGIHFMTHSSLNRFFILILFEDFKSLLRVAD